MIVIDLVRIVSSLSIEKATIIQGRIELNKTVMKLETLQNSSLWSGKLTPYAKTPILEANLNKDKHSTIAIDMQYVLIELFLKVFFEKIMTERTLPINPIAIVTA